MKKKVTELIVCLLSVICFLTACHTPQSEKLADGTYQADVTLTGGPPNGNAALYYGPLSLYNATEPVYPVNGLPLFIGLDRRTAQKVPTLIQLDANGSGTRTFQNTTGATNEWAIQAVLIEPGSGVVGSSSAAFL